MKREAIVKTIKGLSGVAGHKEILKVYNAQNPTPRGYKVSINDAWCAATVSAVFLLNGYNAFSECSCVKMVEKAKAAGLWQEKDDYIPKIGDVILYDWQDNGKGDNKGNPDHVGIVIKVNADSFTVREGNINKSIGERNLKVNGKYIRGFILPPYEERKKKTNKEIAEEVIAGLWSDGAERKELLEAAGYNYRKIQDIVNNKLKK